MLRLYVEAVCWGCMLGLYVGAVCWGCMLGLYVEARSFPPRIPVVSEGVACVAIQP